MSVARTILLKVSDNQWLRATGTRVPFIRRAVTKFMPGEAFDDMLNAAGTTARDGIQAVFTRLGESRLCNHATGSGCQQQAKHDGSPTPRPAIPACTVPPIAHHIILHSIARRPFANGSQKVSFQRLDGWEIALSKMP